MKAFSLMTVLSLMNGLSGCESLNARQIEADLRAQAEASDRIERQNTEIINRLQTQENALKALEPQISALSSQQARLQCMTLSERAHSKCMSLHHTLTDSAVYMDQMHKCLRRDPQYRDDPASCQNEEAKP